MSTNGGSSWIQDVRRLSGNVSAEKVWRTESVDLASYGSSDVKIRFRSTVSDSREDANVDNVQIIAGGSSSMMFSQSLLSSSTSTVPEEPQTTPVINEKKAGKTSLSQTATVPMTFDAKRTSAALTDAAIEQLELDRLDDRLLSQLLQGRR